MKWIGLTGGIASGKSTVAELLQGRGYVIIDADKIAKQVVDPGGPAFNAVVLAFGKEILGPKGEIDRKKLAEIIFQNEKKKLLLEGIIHPEVQKETKRLKKKAEDERRDLCFYDVPLLFEKNLESQFDLVILVYCSERNQILRMKERNLWTDEEIKNRLNNQIPLSEKLKNTKFVIMNDGTLSELEKNVDEVLAKIASA